MNHKLRQFLNDAFEPYGDFPARKDVEQELLANLTEKYDDLKAEGKSDDEAYELTTASFGDVSEIMEQVAHDEQGFKTDGQQNLGKSIAHSVKNVIADSVK